MSALVTGAGGFVGAWLTATLAKTGEHVTAQIRGTPSALFRRLGLETHPAVRTVVDADCAAVLEAHPVDEIFHLAGFSQIGAALSDPLPAFETNARQTWRLLDAVRRAPSPPRTVIASTDSLYGETGGRAATEEDPLRATGPYEASKAMADIAGRSFAATFGLPVVVARLGNVYGPFDANAARLVPGVVGALKAGGVPHLRGGGRAVRALLHVRDCVAGLRLLAANAGAEEVRGEAFNLSGGPPMTTLDIAQTALAAFGRADLRPEVTEGAPGETSVKHSSSAKLIERLGWQPEWTLAAGLADLHAQETDPRE